MLAWILGVIVLIGALWLDARAQQATPQQQLDACQKKLSVANAQLTTAYAGEQDRLSNIWMKGEDAERLSQEQGKTLAKKDARITALTKALEDAGVAVPEEKP